MSDLNKQPVMATELYDAIERRMLASYIQLTKEGKEYLRNCELQPTLQEKETICASKQEFDAFVSSIWSNRGLASSRNFRPPQILF